MFKYLNIAAFSILSFCSTLSSVGFVQAQSTETTVGISAFGIQSENFGSASCERLIKMALAADVPAISILYNTFGADGECLEKFWQTVKEKNKRHITEIHFSNEAGRRGLRLDKLDFLNLLTNIEYKQVLERMPRSLRNKIKIRVKAIRGMIKGQEDTGQFILSTGLEDEFSNKAWENLYEVIRKYWPHQIARSRAHMGLREGEKREKWTPPADVFVESHGYNRKMHQQNCIGNGDGQDVDFIERSGFASRDSKPASKEEVQAWIARGKANNCIMFLWAAKWQGIFGQAPTTLPLKRDFVWDKEDVAVMRGLVREGNN